MIVDIDAFVTPVVMYCDENRLSLSEGNALAEMLADEIRGAVEDRRDYLPPELLDDDEEVRAYG